MTDIDDKALDRWKAVLKPMFRDGHKTGPGIEDADLNIVADEITALRAERDELRARVKELEEVLAKVYHDWDGEPEDGTT